MSIEMVKLNDPFEQAGRAVGERDRARTSTRSHHNWGARFGRSRNEVSSVTEPRGLLELEELASRTVTLMEKHTPKSEHNYEKAMDLLRLQYNMNFIVVCEKCRGPHVSDEILAPER